MSSLITITTPKEYIDSVGTFLKLRLQFTAEEDGGTIQFDAYDRGIRVIDWGELDTSYDFDDLLIVPATIHLVIGDIEGYLDNVFFGSGSFAESIDKRGKVEIYIDDEVDPEYIFYIQEDSIESFTHQKYVTFSADPKIEILNRTRLFDNASPPNALNPMGFDWYNVQPILHFLIKTYQLVNPSLTTVSTSHDWIFKGVRSSDAAVLNNIVFDELRIFGQELIGPNASNYGVSSAGDFIKTMAKIFGAYTGMISHDKAFFNKLFHYDSSNLQSVNILSQNKTYLAQTFEYVEATTHIGTEYSQTYIEPSGALNPNIEGKDLIEDVFTGFMGFDGSLAAHTQVAASVQRGNSDDGYYSIQAVSDSNIDSGVFMDNGSLMAKFWYKHRGLIKNMRIDKFTARGIKYDFTKNFNFNGEKFQIISLRQQLGKNLTHIDAIYLGEV